MDKILNRVRVLDFTDALAGLAKLRDVVVEDFRPGVMREFGLTYEVF